ncbi:MAG: DUF493 domain-containing protein [Desulfobulbaceae bacterium]|nr:DUF493 domain-containing protein [Desulfobulbaceae bacterium]
MNEENSCRPDIVYPCPWQYRLIGEDEAAMQAALAESIDLGRCVLSTGNRSSGGRYLSLQVELIVMSEEERLDLYRQLAAHPAIKMVL